MFVYLNISIPRCGYKNFFKFIRVDYHRMHTISDGPIYNIIVPALYTSWLCRYVYIVFTNIDKKRKVFFVYTCTVYFNYQL